MEKRYEMASGCLKALAHPIRLKILESLRNGEKSVSEIEKYCDQYTQSNISQHLGLMKTRGIIKSIREANQVFYSTVDKDIYKALDLIAKILCKTN